MTLKVATALTVAVLVSLTTVPANAQSSKAAWRFEALIDLASAAAASPGNPTPTPNDTGWVSILTTHIKTPNAKELAIGVSLQCGLITDTTVRSKNGTTDTASAEGRIKILVKITQPDGSEVFAQPDNGRDLGDVLLQAREGVTYCDRFQKLSARFSGLNCTVVSGAVTCADPEELELLIKTMSVHHFNFLFANAIPGVQKVEVLGRAESAAALDGSKLGGAGAAAFAGAGALSVETIRLIKDANGTADLTIN